LNPAETAGAMSTINGRMATDRNSAARRRARLERIADVREASRLLQDLAQPLGAREAVQTWIKRAAKSIDFDLVRAESIWREEARRIDAWEMDILRAAVRGKRRAK